MSDVLNAVMNQYDTNNRSSNKKNKLSEEDRLKRYFSTQLKKNEKTGQRMFRILPPKAGKSPFDEVWFHEVKLDDKWQKLYCPKKNKTGECPLCEVEQSLLATGSKEDKDVSYQYKAKKFYIVKGIDRDLEEDGPKFWRFRHNYKKEGTLDKIVPVFSTKGDITQVDKGRDLIISLGKNDDGYTKVTSIMYEDAGPLSESPEQMEQWLEDEMVWQDVYAIKTYDYLDIVAQGEIPYYDKDQEKYITKTEFEAKNSNGVSVSIVNDDGEKTKIGGAAVNKDEQVKTEGETKTKKVIVTKTKPEIEPEDENNEESDEELTDLPF